MRAVARVSGRAIPLGRDNVDTDQIIAAEHLKTVSRAGLGRHAFAALRGGDGDVLDDPAFAGAPILIAGANFGCGSSREHAVWALADLGIEAVIAPSFADIFAANAYKNGIVTVALPHDAVGELLAAALRGDLLVDLEAMVVAAPGLLFRFELDPFRRSCLMEGLDEIALTLQSEAAIRAYEERAAA